MLITGSTLYAFGDKGRRRSSSLLVLCEYSKFRIESNSYFSIRFDLKRAQLFKIFKYLPSPISYLTQWRRFFTLATTPSNQQNLLLTMVQVLYTLEVFILAHYYGPPSTETPTTETTIVRCHKNSWIYLASTYLLLVTFETNDNYSIRFKISNKSSSIRFEMEKKHYSHSTNHHLILKHITISKSINNGTSPYIYCHIPCEIWIFHCTPEQQLFQFKSCAKITCWQ